MCANDEAVRLLTRWMQEREEEATGNEGDAFLAVGRYIKA